MKHKSFQKILELLDDEILELEREYEKVRKFGLKFYRERNLQEIKDKMEELIDAKMEFISLF